jgi:hypothetical protein
MVKQPCLGRELNASSSTFSKFYDLSLHLLLLLLLLLLLGGTAWPRSKQPRSSFTFVTWSIFNMRISLSNAINWRPCFAENILNRSALDIE